MDGLDWNRVRAFFATVEAGSLSAAARTLGLSQPTLSRQIASFEAELDVTLFERVGKKLVLTEPGTRLLQHARAMGEAATAMTIAASGQSEAIEGSVSVSVSDVYSAYIMPEIVARIRHEVPQITLIVVSSNSLSDLHRREADIAIRNVRPKGDGLIGKLVRESTAYLYASQEWVDCNGLPDSPGAIAPHDLIGFDDTERFSAYMRGVGVPVKADEFRIVSENGVAVWEMVKRGLGLCIMAQEVAKRTDGIVEVFPETPFARFPVWLVTHRELRTSPRIRLIFDILADELERVGDLPKNGQGFAPEPATSPQRQGA